MKKLLEAFFMYLKSRLLVLVQLGQGSLRLFGGLPVLVNIFAAGPLVDGDGAVVVLDGLGQGRGVVLVWNRDFLVLALLVKLAQELAGCFQLFLAGLDGLALVRHGLAHDLGRVVDQLFASLLLFLLGLDGGLVVSQRLLPLAGHVLLNPIRLLLDRRQLL